MSWTGASLPRDEEIGALLTSIVDLGACFVIFEILEAEVDIGLTIGWVVFLVAILPGVIGSVESLFFLFLIGFK